ncbi:MAG: sensor histidine kinase [Mucilaginibacter sp.]
MRYLARKKGEKRRMGAKAIAYHGLRAKDKQFNAPLVTDFDAKLPRINVIPEDIGRVMLNVIKNAFMQCSKRRKPLKTDTNLAISTTHQYGSVIISVKDNGNGIPDNMKDEIMQPLFTTKPTGEGTGLGLSLSYDIVVKGHGGKINAGSKEGEGSEFIIQIPVN